MKRAIITIFILLTTLCSTVGAGESIKHEYSYRRYTTHDGLPSVYIDCITQDNNGFIWLAGAAGISRFDGFEFKTFLKGTYANIFRLTTGDEGHIRAFTANLMYTVDPGNDTLITTALSPGELEMTANSSKLLPGNLGIMKNIGVQNDQALYAIRDSGVVKIVEHEDLTTFPDVNIVYWDREHERLYIPYDEAIYVISAKSGEVWHHDNITAIGFCKDDDNILVLASDGIHSINDREIKHILRHDIDYFAGGKIVKEGNEIFFSTHEGFYRVMGERVDTLLTANFVRDFLIDSDKNIWVATYQGLYNLFRLDFNLYTLPDKEDVPRNILYDHSRDMAIIATLNGRVYEIGERVNREITYPDNPYDAAFFYDYGCIMNGALYLPGPADVLILKGGQKRWLGLPFHPSQRFVSALPDGDLICGGAGRLFIFTPEGKVLRDFGKETVGQTVYAKPSVDNRGRLWLGGYSGISIFDLSTDSVRTIFNDDLRLMRVMTEDHDGNIWSASENRLYISDGDTVALKNSFDSVIKGILITKRGAVIVSTLSGIYISGKGESNYVFYNHENGFSGQEPASGAMVEGSDGDVWMAALTGVFRFNPEQLLRTQPRPRLMMLSEMSSENNIDWTPLKEENPELRFRDNNIRLSYIGLTYTSAQNTRYRYRLIGFQDEWSDPIAAREVTFNNLPPGNYMFQLKADSGVEGTETDIINRPIRVIPAFWQTAWFPIAVILLLMFSSAAIALFFQRRKNRELIERLETEKQLNELRIKTIRLKAIPHFNANVLAAIEYYIMNKSKDEAIRLLGIYSRFTFQTLCEVDRASRSLNEEIEYVRMYLELEKLRFLDKFDYSIEIDPTVDNNIQLPNMILHTYCENALKHGIIPMDSEGRISIKVSRHDDKVTVSVEDNGVGRAAAAKNRNVRSSKQGLDILLRQIEINNRFNKDKIRQEIEDIYINKRAAGTRVEVTVPIGFVYQ